MAKEIDIYSDHLIFEAKCGNWVVSKAMALGASVTNDQAAQFLTDISRTAEQQAYDVLGIKTKALDTFAQTIAKEAKGSLANAVLSLSKSGAKSVVQRSVPDRKLETVARAYLLKKVMSEFQ